MPINPATGRRYGAESFSTVRKWMQEARAAAKAESRAKYLQDCIDAGQPFKPHKGKGRIKDPVKRLAEREQRQAAALRAEPDGYKRRVLEFRFAKLNQNILEGKYKKKPLGALKYK
jgi:hypothetical protein